MALMVVSRCFSSVHFSFVGLISYVAPNYPSILRHFGCMRRFSTNFMLKAFQMREKIKTSSNADKSPQITLFSFFVHVQIHDGCRCWLLVQQWRFLPSSASGHRHTVIAGCGHSYVESLFHFWHFFGISEFCCCCCCWFSVPPCRT